MYAQFARNTATLQYSLTLGQVLSVSIEVDRSQFSSTANTLPGPFTWRPPIRSPGIRPGILGFPSAASDQLEEYEGFRN